MRKLTAQKIAQAEKFSDEYKLDLFLDFVNYPEYNEMMDLNPELEAIGIEASKLNKERNRIINSPGIDGAEKRQQIDVIEQKLLMLFQKTMQNVKNLDLKVNDPFFKFGGFQSKGGPSIEIGSFKLGGNK